jgi:hypothetical protein
MRRAFVKSAAAAVAVNAVLWVVAAVIGLVPALGESTFFGGVLFASFGATAAAAIVASRFTAALICLATCARCRKPSNLSIQSS